MQIIPTFKSALLGLVLVGLGAAAQAQDTTADATAPATLAAHLNTCFTPDTTTDAALTLWLTYSSTGEVAGAALSVAPDPLHEAERALFAKALTAYVTCAPIDLGLLPKDRTSVEVNVAGLGFSQVVAMADTTDADASVADNEAATSDQPAPGGASRADEDALNLTLLDRREIQRRLTLLSYDTRGVDGVFGRGTRGAVSAWQKAAGFVESGYLNAEQLAALKAESAAAYVEWDAQPKRYVGPEGCLREPNGRIIRGRSTACDLLSLTQ